MNSMQVIERLVSLRNNACNRATEESRKNTECNIYQMRVSLLENGINQLIIEMQNTIMAEYRIKNPKPPIHASMVIISDQVNHPNQ